MNVIEFGLDRRVTAVICQKLDCGSPVSVGKINNSSEQPVWWVNSLLILSESRLMESVTTRDKLRDFSLEITCSGNTINELLCHAYRSGFIRLNCRVTLHKQNQNVLELDAHGCKRTTHSTVMLTSSRRRRLSFCLTPEPLTFYYTTRVSFLSVTSAGTQAGWALCVFFCIHCIADL